ncbi:MAG: hypothetical protein AVDCRST_MAG49-163, partial [uncultured Thermomicrobiales bacterium]
DPHAAPRHAPASHPGRGPPRGLAARRGPRRVRGHVRDDGRARARLRAGRCPGRRHRRDPLPVVRRSRRQRTHPVHRQPPDRRPRRQHGGRARPGAGLRPRRGAHHRRPRLGEGDPLLAGAVRDLGGGDLPAQRRRLPRQRTRRRPDARPRQPHPPSGLRLRPRRDLRDRARGRSGRHGHRTGDRSPGRARRGGRHLRRPRRRRRRRVPGLPGPRWRDRRQRDPARRVARRRRLRPADRVTPGDWRPVRRPCRHAGRRPRPAM